MSMQHKASLLKRRRVLRAANREQINASVRAKYAMDCERIKARNRASYAEHVTQRLASAKAHRKKNRHSINMAVRARRESNPELTRLKAREYRMRNLDIVRARERAAYAKNKNRVLDARRIYYNKNAIRICLSAKTRHASSPWRGRLASKVSHAKAKAFISGIKMSNPCADCCNWFPYYCMQFDHVAGKKLWSPRRIAKSQTIYDFVDSEMRKCHLLCANCHRKRTQLRKRSKNPTGKRRQLRPGRDAFIAGIKMSNPCADCDEFFSYYCIDWDHVVGKKIKEPSRMRSYNFVNTEMRKCQPVCSTCHLKRTQHRLRKNGRHK